MAVSFIKTDSYEQKTVRGAVERMFELQGADIPRGARVVLKPNLIMRCQPSRAATTHPEVVRAVSMALLDRGVTDITLAESSGGLYTPPVLSSLYESTGMKAVAEQTGIKLNFDTSALVVKREQNDICKQLDIIAPLTGDAFVINMCKLKTHGMMTMTAGIKNLFGSIPGLIKPELHYRFPQRELFARMLIDIYRTVAPAYTILDAVDGMEGDGPTAGTPRHVGLMAMASGIETFSLDLVLAHLIGLKPEQVPTVAESVRQGACPASWEDVELSGDVDAAHGVYPFEIPKSRTLDFAENVWAPLRPLVRAMRPMLESRPVIKTQKCVGCGKCAETCPSHTIEVEDGKARVIPSGCIHCFCCHELCPVQAIAIKKPGLFRFLTK